MKKFAAASLALFVISMNSAFAEKLGNLPEDKQPKDLTPAADVVKNSTPSTSPEGNNTQDAPTTSPSINTQNFYGDSGWGNNWGSGYYGGNYGTGYYRGYYYPRVTCYSQDYTGVWYGVTDDVVNAYIAQQMANNECFFSGLGCYASLGCAYGY